MGKPSSIAHLGQPGLLWGIEPDVEGPEVVVELSQAASSHNRCGDSGLSRVRASATREGVGAELGGDVLHHRGDVQPALGEEPVPRRDLLAARRPPSGLGSRSERPYFPVRTPPPAVISR